jgi:ribosomal protein S20
VRHRKPLPPEEVTPAQETAATPGPAARPAIGELSSGDPTNSRSQTEASIASIERGLNSINRNLSDSDQKTASNIREDIKQAKAALASGDVDGAQTLVAKARVLLDELNK